MNNQSTLAKAWVVCARSGRWLLTALLVFTLLACSTEDRSPEQRIRDRIFQAQQAGEARDRDFFEDLLAPDYADQAGRSREDVLRLISVYFLRNQSIHLFVKTPEVELTGPDRANALVYSGMAGSPVEGFEQLLAMRAAVYRLELVFNLDDEPLLLSAQWRRLSPGELIP